VTDAGVTYVEVRGCRTAVRTLGSGQPLLFLRGFDVAFNDDLFVDALHSDFKVIIPDHPGFGGSDVSNSGQTVADLAYFYLDFLDAVGLADVHLLGASIGGWIAAELALRTDRRVRTLTLLGPAGVRKRGVGFGDPFIKSPGVAAAMLFAAPDRASRLHRGSERDEDIDLQLKNNYALAKISWHPRFENPTLQRWLHRISVPVQILWGEHDAVIPIEHSEVWCAQIPSASFKSVKGSGHLLHLEAPELVAREVTSFLRAHAK